MAILSAVTKNFERRKDMKKDSFACFSVENAQIQSNTDNYEAAKLFSKLSPSDKQAIIEFMKSLLEKK